jgi:hypothetical protein
VLRRLLLLTPVVLLLLPGCGSDDPPARSDPTTTVQAGGGGAADGCEAWQAFLSDGDRAHVEDLLAGHPTDEVAQAGRQLLANFDPETTEGQDAHETAVDVITAALRCGDGDTPPAGG